MLWIILLLVVLAIAGAPGWGYWGGRQYGWTPSGVLTAIVVVLVLYWLLTGRHP